MRHVSRTALRKKFRRTRRYRLITKRIPRKIRRQRIYKTMYQRTLKGKTTSDAQLAAWNHVSKPTVRRYLREIQNSLQRNRNQRLILKDRRWLLISLEAEERKRPKLPAIQGKTIFMVVEMDSQPTKGRPLHLRIGRIVSRNDADIHRVFEAIKEEVKKKWGKVSKAIQGYRLDPDVAGKFDYRQFKHEKSGEWRDW